MQIEEENNEKFYIKWGLIGGTVLVVITLILIITWIFTKKPQQINLDNIEKPSPHTSNSSLSTNNSSDSDSISLDSFSVNRNLSSKEPNLSKRDKTNQPKEKRKLGLLGVESDEENKVIDTEQEEETDKMNKLLKTNVNGTQSVEEKINNNGVEVGVSEERKVPKENEEINNNGLEVGVSEERDSNALEVNALEKRQIIEEDKPEINEKNPIKWLMLKLGRRRG